MSRGDYTFSSQKGHVPSHITVDLGGQKAASANGSQNNYFVMEVLDESGKKTKGFFTPNRSVSLESELNNYWRSYNVPEGHESLDIIRRRITETPDGINKMVETIEKNCQDTIDNIKGYRNDPMLLGDIVNAIADTFGIEKEDCDVIKEDEYASDYLFDALNYIDDAKDKINLYTNTGKMSLDSNINRRNNLMYAYAELLGLSELIANSSTMTVVDGDKEIHGTFMTNAQGISYKTLEDKSKYGSQPLSLTVSGMKSISNLQILDFLCANYDRHQDNMFYRVDKSDPERLKLVGVQGIDNDGSFGNIDGKSVTDDKGARVYDYMSLISDIKVIDEKTAKAVLEMKQEDVEKLTRLAGLSADEIEAAQKRLTLLKDSVKSGKIKILKTEADWKKLIEGNKIKEDLQAKEKEGTSLYNIYGHIDKMVQNHDGNHDYSSELYNEYVDDKEVEYLPENELREDDPANVKGKIPTVNTVNTENSYDLDNSIEFLEDVRRGLKNEMNRRKEPDAATDERTGDYEKNYKAFDEQLQATLNDMQRVQSEVEKRDNGDRALSSNQKNLISESLIDLKTAADTYISKKHEDPKKNPGVKAQINAAKNIKVYSEAAQQAVIEDTIALDMLITEKEYTKLSYSLNKPATEITFEKLEERVQGIAGRSTHFYRDMITALQQQGDLSRFTKNSDKIKCCDALADAAKNYLKHKIPKGSEAGLKPKEKKRVKFARDLLEYAEKNKEFITYKRDEKKKEINDYKSMSAFHAKYDSLYEKFNRVSNDTNATKEMKKKIADEILDQKADFLKGYKNILNVSDSYYENHDMQAVCATMLQGGVSGFMKIFKECAEKRDAREYKDDPAAFGISESDKKRALEVIKKGQYNLDSYKKKNKNENVSAEHIENGTAEISDRNQSIGERQQHI